MQFLLGNVADDNQPIETQMTTKDELEYFMKEPDLDPDSNPLEWWRKNCERFPALSLYANKLLCVPATSVSSERIFSVAGNIVTKKRSNLLPENVDMLVFLHKNLPPV